MSSAESEIVTGIQAFFLRDFLVQLLTLMGKRRHFLNELLTIYKIDNKISF